MRINIKNLKGEVFTVEAEPTQTIFNLKEKLFCQKGLPVDTQKIIYKGKTTNNDEILGQLSMRETDFLVMMTQIQKPQPKALASENISTSQKQVETKQTEPQKKASAETKTDETQLINLMAMGFSKQQCLNALTASNNNFGIAIEHILSEGGSQTDPQDEEQKEDVNEQLASFPELEEIKNMIQNDPNIMPEVMARLAEASPELYNLISKHPRQFEDLLMGNDEMEVEEVEEEEFQGQNNEDSAEQEIFLTEQEDEAVNRLINLGFSREQAVQAYLTCEKNEQAAANLLFDSLANGQMSDAYPGQQDMEEEDEDDFFN